MAIAPNLFLACAVVAEVTNSRLAIKMNAIDVIVFFICNPFKNLFLAMTGPDRLNSFDLITLLLWEMRVIFKLNICNIGRCLILFDYLVLETETFF